MSRLVWDKAGERTYETGVEHGVLYVQDNKGVYGKGVAWNGLTAVSESPTGAEATAIYADDIKYLNIISAEEFEATIEAYTYPQEFELCDGSADLGGATPAGIVIGQQARRGFAFAYKTILGNDAVNNDYGYKLHIIYGCVAAPSEKAYATINDSPEAITFSWDVKTTPVAVTGYKPTATLVIDSTETDEDLLKQIEDKLYGTDAGSGGSPEATDPTLLMPNDILGMLASAGG